MNFFLQIVRLRKKSFVAIAALTVANILLYSYVFHFQQPKLETLHTLWLEKRQRPASTTDKSTIFFQGKKDVAVFQSMIPPKREFIRVVGEIFDIASNNGLSIGNMDYKPEVIKDRPLLVYNMKFAVTGSYGAIKSFISDIERSREILAIDNMSLASSDPSQDSVKISMEISAFFRTDRS